ncbi:MAG: UDP-N-acetylglucosamine 2-epimerase (non-hydrolyzing) [Candidatus Paceibacterota bacterium]|jgi:UDP-N-acetylglucosamine 2-epimerase (non-hydrolysing)
MKIATILGTRPEIIRLNLIIKKLDKYSEHTMIYTGQNHSSSLKDIFFEQLKLRKPNFYLNAIDSSIGPQLSKIIGETYKILKKINPDKVLILGDTNSGLASIVAEKMMIPVYHMEAGNRCHDLSVPEEKNRHTIDAISSYNLPYTPGSYNNLMKEGHSPKKTIVTGNPINEVLIHFRKEIDNSKILKKLSLKKKNYFIVTSHRAENVDNPQRLKEIFKGLDLVARKYKMPIIVSLHPRTREKMKKFGIKPKSKLIKLSKPFGFFDFVKLEKNALCAISDSGTVQEECCILRVPTVTIRTTTERPETIECGSNILSGLNSAKILKCVRIMLKRKTSWEQPKGYSDKNVSEKIIKLILNK